MTIDVDKICQQVHADLADDKKDFNLGNIRVSDFEDEILICVLKENYPESVDSEIYHFQFGNYFITDRGWIFSKKTKYERIEKAAANTHIFNSLSSSMSKKQFARFIKNNAPDSQDEFEVRETYFIYKRSANDTHMRFYISGRWASLFELNGYKVTREKSFQKYLNIKTGEMNHIMTYSIRLSKDVFETFCKSKDFIKRGTNIVNGQEVTVHSGRPRKMIILLDDDGNELKFTGYQECAQHFDISLPTVKRAFKNKGAGDTVKLKKTNFQLLG